MAHDRFYQTMPLDLTTALASDASTQQGAGHMGERTRGMLVHGYMIEAEWDGHVLRVRGTNKASRIALSGKDHGEDIVVPAEQMTSVKYRKANIAVNGQLTVQTSDDKTYRLHFRRKSNDEFAALAEQLGATPA